MTTVHGQRSTVNDSYHRLINHLKFSDMNYAGKCSVLNAEWDINPRWKQVLRPYSADDVLRLRGKVEIEYSLARQGAEKLWTMLHNQSCVSALGALTGNQAIQE